MAYEDFTTYTEFGSPGAGASVNVAATQCTISLIRMDADYSLYKDYDADHFGNFNHLIETLCSAVTSDQFVYGGIWSAGNQEAPNQQSLNNNANGIWLSWRSPEADQTVGIRLENETVTPDSRDTSILLTKSVIHFIEMERTASVINAFIRTGSHAGDLVDTITVSHSATAFRYLSTGDSRSASTSSSRITYNTYRLDLQEGAPPTGGTTGIMTTFSSYWGGL